MENRLINKLESGRDSLQGKERVCKSVGRSWVQGRGREPLGKGIDKNGRKQRSESCT
jgi:hypothetical protein